MVLSQIGKKGTTPVSAFGGVGQGKLGLNGLVLDLDFAAFGLSVATDFSFHSLFKAFVLAVDLAFGLPFDVGFMAFGLALAFDLS